MTTVDVPLSCGTYYCRPTTQFSPVFQSWLWIHWQRHCSRCQVGPSYFSATKLFRTANCPQLTYRWGIWLEQWNFRLNCIVSNKGQHHSGYLCFQHNDLLQNLLGLDVFPVAVPFPSIVWEKAMRSVTTANLVSILAAWCNLALCYKISLKRPPLYTLNQGILNWGGSYSFVSHTKDGLFSKVDIS